jgi:RNA polymerase sigma-70 factor, ECF subfamily
MLDLAEEPVRTDTVVSDKERFQELATAQLPRLYSIARRLVGDDAEDAVQECLMKAYDRFGQLQSEEAGPSWLISILINLSRDKGRVKARTPDTVQFDDVDEFSLYRKIANEDPFPYSDTLHLDFLHRFGKEDVKEVLLSMPEMYRTPLVLVHMYGYSTKEVARLLDAPLGTVLARLHRARKLFERHMWEYADANDLLNERVR